MLLTSRPYDHIVSGYNYKAISSRVNVPGEEESETISKEANLVIKYRLNELYSRKRFNQDLHSNLEKRLLSEVHRTYLWIYLVLDEVEQGWKKTEKEMEKLLDNLPRTVNEAYEKILNRFTQDEEIRQAVFQALCLLIAVESPPTLEDMQAAVKIKLNPPSTSFTDLDFGA